MLIADAAKAFAQAQKAKGRSRSTVRNAESTCASLLRFARARNIGHVDGLDSAAIRDWQADLAEGAASTARTRSQIASQFLRFCAGEGWAESAPKVSLPAVPNSLHPDVLSEDQEAALIVQVMAHNGRNSERTRALVLFALGTGCRVCELVRLNVQDVDLDTMRATIKKGKGSKTRRVTAKKGGAAGKALRKYLRGRDDLLDDDAPLFASERGGRMTEAAVQASFRRFGRKIGVKFSPHTLRRTWATRCVTKGMSLMGLMEVGGWSDLESVQRYLHLATDSGLDSAQQFTSY